MGRWLMVMDCLEWERCGSLHESIEEGRGWLRWGWSPVGVDWMRIEWEGKDGLSRRRWLVDEEAACDWGVDGME